MSGYWVVAADSAKARIFSRSKRFSPMEELQTLVHPESRLQRQDLVSDRPGVVHESRTPGESSNEEPTDPKVAEAQVFARDLAARLREARLAGDYSALILVADPKFLGLLRKSIDDDTRKCIEHEVSKNVTREAIERIVRAIDSGA
jgi:protein required for attachment to host cells